ncbi:MAG: stage V sporulation protein AB [Lachnospiraceae bacterium]|nr:stage V sporulation protein AB [Lachnospiraceae bacterium]
MWTTDLFLVLLGLICGLAVAAGAFALIAGLGLIPRLAGKTSAAAYVIPLENAVIYGGIFGAVIALFDQIPLRIGSWFTLVYGLSAGVFTGCLSVALAEVLNVFPILFRRAKIKRGLNLMVFFFALGKMAGALYYFMILF